MNEKYQEYGFKNRYQYLEYLAEEYEQELWLVQAAAYCLGPHCDFDLLVGALKKQRDG